MNLQEREACELLKLSRENIMEKSSSTFNIDSYTLAEIIEQRKKRRLGKCNPYTNVDFILGSTGQIERQFSKSRAVGSKDRQSYTSYLCESLVLLKINREY